MRKRTEPLGECSIESCSRPAKYANTGWCQTHYHRWWRNGDPGVVRQERGARGTATVNWKGDDITYRTAHTRLTQAKGKASQQDCVRCGKQALHWAYDHTDPDEKIYESPRGPIAYSVDLDRYQPMCRGCHVKLDRYERVTA